MLSDKSRADLKVVFEDWIREANLNLMLVYLSHTAEVQFSDLDWDAIRLGIREPDSGSSGWYDYSLYGATTISLSLRRAEQLQRVEIRAEATAIIISKIRGIVTILQQFNHDDFAGSLEALIRQAFPVERQVFEGNILSCTDDHLAVCEECQEVSDYFKGKNWLDLMHDDSPSLYQMGLPRLRPPIAQSFFPTSLVFALKFKDSEILTTALAVIKSPERSFNALQSEIIAFVTYILMKTL